MHKRLQTLTLSPLARDLFKVLDPFW